MRLLPRTDAAPAGGTRAGARGGSRGGSFAPGSFEDFYRQELAGLVALAAALCGRASAEDVAQEAMLVTYRRWREVGERDHPAAFARRTCANLAVSAHRRRSSESRALLRLAARPQPPLEDPGEQDDEYAAFWSALRALPPRQAQVAALRYVFDLEVAQIALTLGVTDGTVKTQLHRARIAMASRLGLTEEDRP